MTGTLDRIPRIPARILAASIVATACGEASPPPPSPPAPVIAAFSATPPAIIVGGASVLDWDVRGADSVRIEPLPGTLHGTALVVSPASDTTYVLVATNAGGKPGARWFSRYRVRPSRRPIHRTCASADCRVGAWSSPGASPGSRAGTASSEWRASKPTTPLLPRWVEIRSSSSTGQPPPTISTDTGFGRRASRARARGRWRPPSLLPLPPEGPSLAVTPAAAGVAPGAEMLFTSSGPAAWAVLEGRAGGTISAAGGYRAPAGAGIWHVVADGGVSAVATVAVQ